MPPQAQPNTAQFWMAAAIARVTYVLERAWDRAASCFSRSHIASTTESGLYDFEGLQDVLRIAEQCPVGLAGDDIRRAACEFIEADSVAARHTGRRRMLKAIARVEWRRARGRGRADDPGPLVLKRLAEALRRDGRAN